MPIYSSVFSNRISTSRLEGDIIFILRTLRSMIDSGKSNSSTMQRGIAPPQGLALSSLRSNNQVWIPALARTSAAQEPLGPPPTTATRNILTGSFGRAFAETNTAAELFEAAHSYYLRIKSHLRSSCATSC
eukprot:gb/GEZN01004267.1/.p3 GENE.gb/GEZN01004267.1/~~gb/GEZN01004267.1/.p3  ORF type:complete len:131 (+),score=2.59 gb/GEZN01004267.1/:863-1255(+)